VDLFPSHVLRVFFVFVVVFSVPTRHIEWKRVIHFRVSPRRRTRERVIYIYIYTRARERRDMVRDAARAHTARDVHAIESSSSLHSSPATPSRSALACGIPIDLRFRTSDDEAPDFIDDALDALRADVLSRRMAMTTPMDRLRATLAARAHETLRTCATDARCASKGEAMKRVMEDARARVWAPGEAGYDGIPGAEREAESEAEREAYRAFTRRCREAIATRLVERCYNGVTGERDKFWMAFAKRRFMNRV